MARATGERALLGIVGDSDWETRSMGWEGKLRAAKPRFDSHCTDFHDLHGVSGIRGDRDPLPVRVLVIATPGGVGIRASGRALMPVSFLFPSLRSEKVESSMAEYRDSGAEGNMRRWILSCARRTVME